MAVGDRVRVRQGVGPEYGMGAAQDSRTGEMQIGVVRAAHGGRAGMDRGGQGRDITIEFPDQSDWMGKEYEPEILDNGSGSQSTRNPRHDLIPRDVSERFLWASGNAGDELLGRYRAVNPCMLHSGSDLSSDPLHELDVGEAVEVLEAKMANGTMRLRTERGWLSLKPHLVEKLADGESMEPPDAETLEFERYVARRSAMSFQGAGPAGVRAMVLS